MSHKDTEYKDNKNEGVTEIDDDSIVFSKTDSKNISDSNTGSNINKKVDKDTKSDINNGNIEKGTENITAEIKISKKGIFIMSLLFLALLYILAGKSQSPLKIMGALGTNNTGTKDEENITTSRETYVEGVIHYKNIPVAKVDVWGFESDKQKNRAYFGSIRTNESGAFHFPLKTPLHELEDVQIFAHAEGDLRTAFYERTGNINLTPYGGLEGQLFDHGKTWLAVIFAVFGISICIAVVGAHYSRASKLTYYLSFALALILSGLMVWVTGSSVKMVDVTSDGNVITLGFATIYKASFVESVDEDWVVSLTSVPSQHTHVKAGQGKEDQQKPIRALGAPLWVVFLSVIGAALFTVALLVKEIKTPPDFRKLQEVRDSLQRIIQHQFFILFSPLGGILLYQTLVLAKAATEPVTVAFVALGSGISLNAVLGRAVSASSKWLDRNEEDGSTDNKG